MTKCFDSATFRSGAGSGLQQPPEHQGKRIHPFFGGPSYFLSRRAQGAKSGDPRENYTGPRRR
jgi:hypothetical protein